MIDIHNLSLLQRILLSTDGTVTDLIALYSGEAIHVRKVRQALASQSLPQVLRTAREPQPAMLQILSRQILLSGAQRNYLYADSQFVFERFSPAVQRQLLDTDKPIGVMWKEERMETYREIIDKHVTQCPDIASHFDLPVSAWFVARTYIIHHSGQPLGAITEQWPVSLFA